MGNYPDEGIRSVLASVVDNGADITKPLLATFDAVVPDYDIKLNQEIRSRIIEAGYEIGEVENYGEDDENRVLFECNKTMVLSHSAVCHEYDTVDRAVAPFRGYCDGFVVTLP